MARYTEARCRLCRHIGEKLFLKGEKCSSLKCPLERRGSPPGQHLVRRKLSDYGIQLKEKQKVKHIYGVLERQFKRYFEVAEKMPGLTGENLLQLLERRLDNVVYRLGFAHSRAQARQLVRHGHFLINGRKTDIPSYWVKPGDIISWRDKETEYYKLLCQSLPDHPLPSWLSLDKGEMIGKVLSLPKREELELKIDEKAIVEYYAK